MGPAGHLLELSGAGELRLYPGPADRLVPGVHGGLPARDPPLERGCGRPAQPRDDEQLLPVRRAHHVKLGHLYLRREQRPCAPGQHGLLHRAGAGGPDGGHRLPGAPEQGGDGHLPHRRGGHRLSHRAHGAVSHPGPGHCRALHGVRGAEKTGPAHGPDLPVHGDAVHDALCAGVFCLVVRGPRGDDGGAGRGELLAPARLRRGDVGPAAAV